MFTCNPKFLVTTWKRIWLHRPGLLDAQLCHVWAPAMGAPAKPSFCWVYTSVGSKEYGILFVFRSQNSQAWTTLPKTAHKSFPNSNHHPQPLWNDHTCLICFNFLWLGVRLQGIPSLKLDPWGQWLPSPDPSSLGYRGHKANKRPRPILSWWHVVHLAIGLKGLTNRLNHLGVEPEKTRLSKLFVSKDPKLSPDGVRAHLAARVSGAFASLALAFALFLGFALSPCCKPLAAACKRAWREWYSRWKKPVSFDWWFIPLCLTCSTIRYLMQDFFIHDRWTMWGGEEWKRASKGQQDNPYSKDPIIFETYWTWDHCWIFFWWFTICMVYVGWQTKTLAWPPPFDTTWICPPRSEKISDSFSHLWLPGILTPAFVGRQSPTWC